MDNPNKLIIEAIRLLGNNSFNGNPNQWFEYKIRNNNIIEALTLNKEQAIKFIKLSFTGEAIFCLRKCRYRHISTRYEWNSNHWIY